MIDDKKYQVRYQSRGKQEETALMNRQETIEFIFMQGGESIRGIFSDGDSLGSEKTLSLLREAKVFSS
ncbi:MAG: hypothetical protein U1F65_02705 [Verrucomicrobiota bacterium]